MNNYVNIMTLINYNRTCTKNTLYRRGKYKMANEQNLIPQQHKLTVEEQSKRR